MAEPSIEKQMTLADLVPAPRIAMASGANLDVAVAGWLRARHARRRQAAALQELLFAPEHRLRDLGISREELVRTMEIHRK
jgi:uncharacterized protein YjiS (DUF1127 family)